MLECLKSSTPATALYSKSFHISEKFSENMSPIGQASVREVWERASRASRERTKYETVKAKGEVGRG